MAKGPSVFAASTLIEEPAGEYRRTVARPFEAESRVLVMQQKLHLWAVIPHQWHEHMESRMR